MKSARFALALVFGLFATTVAQAGVLDLSIASLSDAGIRLQGDSNTQSAELTFLHGSSGQDFQITDPASSSAYNLQGTLNGSFSYYASASTTSGNTETIDPLTSSGAYLTITDGSSTDLKAFIGDTTLTRVSKSGTVNSDFTMNITSVTYAGSNIDLQKIANAGAAGLQLTFTLVGLNDTNGNTLKGLAETGGSIERIGSYQGTLSAVPEPGSMVMTALVAMPFAGLAYRRRRRNAA